MHQTYGSRLAVVVRSWHTGAIAIVAVGLAIAAWVALPTQQGFVALAVILVLGVLAVMNRPPTRDATGRRLRSTTVVNSVLVIGLAAIPIGIAAIGLTGGRSAAPIALGIGFAEFGLIAFALYSLVWAATRRTTLAAALALIVAGIVWFLLALPAFLDQLAGRNPF
jgi:hypothetical protein